MVQTPARSHMGYQSDGIYEVAKVCTSQVVFLRTRDNKKLILSLRTGMERGAKSPTYIIESVADHKRREELETAAERLQLEEQNALMGEVNKAWHEIGAAAFEKDIDKLRNAMLKLEIMLEPEEEAASA